MGNVIVTKCCQNCTKDKEGGDIAIDELENITRSEEHTSELQSPS